MSDDADITIARMKAANMKALPIKEIRLKNNLLQQESVTLYTVSDTSGRRFTGIKEHWTYVPEVGQPVAVIYPDPALFTYNRDKYIWKEGYEYWQKGDLFLPVEVKKRSGKDAVCYDFNTSRVILQVPDGNPDMMIAVDYGKNMNSSFNSVPEVKYNKDLYENCKTLSTFCRVLISLSEDAYFLSYIETEEHRKMLELIDAVVNIDIVRFNQLMRDEIVDYSTCTNLFVNGYNMIYYRYNLYVDYSEFQPLLINLNSILSSLLNLDLEFWNFCYKYKKSLPPDDVWTIKNFAGKTKWKMYILGSKPETVYYTISHKGGKNKKNITTVASSYCALQVFDIDLSSYEEITSVVVESPRGSDNIAYVALLPADTEFEATSYNPDGSVFCRFDQHGNLEHYEYDASGRLIKVFDRNGNLLKEQKYNKILN